MNTGAMWGWIGGIAGGIIGLAGGIVGTYFSIKNTSGPRERSFMIKSASVCWIAILIFFGLLLSLPSPYRWFMWIPYGILLPLCIIYINRRQQAFRQEESQNTANQARGCFRRLECLVRPHSPKPEALSGVATRPATFERPSL